MEEEHKCKHCGELLEDLFCKKCGYQYELDKGRLWITAQPDAPSMNMWSICRFCGSLLSDFEGNTSWDTPEEEKTVMVCDRCRQDQRSIVMINEFVSGKEYDFPYNRSHIRFLYKELLKKYGPKSTKSHPYIQFALGVEKVDYHPSDAVKVGKT